MASAGEISPASGTNLYVGDQINFSCTATFDYPERCSSIFYNFYGNDSSGNRTFYVADSEEYSGYNAQITFSHSVTIPASTAQVYAYIGFSYSTSSWYYTIERTAEYPCGTREPVITKQPVLSLGSSSGASVNMTWTAAEVSYADGATIYYQFFVGPSSSYSDSYHIGTTTGLSHTMTEAEIISKCGNGYGASSSGSVCYLFVRAYWQKGSTTGGWSTPTGVAFTYYPTINAPTNASLSPTKGKTTSISWTNRLAGNNSQPQSILRRKSGGSWVNIVAGISSVYTVPESVWKALGKGTYELCIAHEWYGRYANGSSMYFEYSPDNTVRIDGDDCVAYLWDETESEWKQCDQYIWDESSTEWVLCSTT